MGITDTVYRGVDNVRPLAEDECLVAFEPFVGTQYQSSELFLGYLTLTQNSWDEGDRAIVCYVFLEGAQLTGSARNSGR